MQTQPLLFSLSDVRIRALTREDLPALEWEGEFTHFRRLYQDIYQSSRRGEAVLWVAELNPVGVIGQLFVQLNSARSELADGASRAYIYGFRIRAEYRNQGLGTLMLEVTERDLVKRGYRWAVLNVNRDNPDARRLYERLGYKIVAVEAGRWTYLDENGVRREVNEPAWRMEKAIKER
jgi:ribosomal protein S18 acetylase RimI-like enzyme